MGLWYFFSYPPNWPEFSLSWIQWCPSWPLGPMCSFSSFPVSDSATLWSPRPFLTWCTSSGQSHLQLGGELFPKSHAMALSTSLSDYECIWSAMKRWCHSNKSFEVGARPVIYEACRHPQGYVGMREAHGIHRWQLHESWGKRPQKVNNKNQKHLLIPRSWTEASELWEIHIYCLKHSLHGLSLWLLQQVNTSALWAFRLCKVHKLQMSPVRCLAFWKLCGEREQKEQWGREVEAVGGKEDIWRTGWVREEVKDDVEVLVGQRRKMYFVFSVHW